MQHIYEFIAVKKLTSAEEEFNKTIGLDEKDKKVPLTINRYFNSNSGRKSKATIQIFKELNKVFGINGEKDLSAFYIKQHR